MLNLLATLTTIALFWKLVDFIKREYIDAPVRDSEHIDEPDIVQAVETPEVEVTVDMEALRQHLDSVVPEDVRALIDRNLPAYSGDVEDTWPGGKGAA